jgi:hypothetical protein
MIQFEMRKSFFVNMINKMAIPVNTRDSTFIFPIIALTIRPDSEIEWIGGSDHVFVWVRVKNITINPYVPKPLDFVKIPINVVNFLSNLKLFESNDIIYFTHDPDQGFDYLVSIRGSERHSVRMPTTALSEVKDICDRLPFRYEENTEIIMFKNGLVIPDVSGSCNVKLFKDIVKATKILKNTQKMRFEEKKHEIKKMTLRADYNINIDGSTHRIQVVAGDDHAIPLDFIVKSVMRDDVKGHGKLHFASGFTNVIKVLSGDIKFYAVDNGPLWIMQDKDQGKNRPLIKVRYLIAPAEVYI